MPAKVNRNWLSKWRGSPAIAVMAIGIALSVLGWSFTSHRVEQQALMKADAAVADAADSVQARLRSVHDIIYGVHGLFRASEFVDRAEFHRYVSGLDLPVRHRGIRTVSYSEHVTAAQRSDLEARVRQDQRGQAAAYADFTVHPAGERADYLPIVMIEPLEGNKAAIGLDIAREPLRRQGIESARDSGLPITSGPQPLSTIDPTRQPAFNVRIAIYRNDAPLETLEERRAAFVGIVTVTCIVRDLFGDILGHPTLAPMSVRLSDRTPDARGGTAEEVLFDNAASPGADSAATGGFTRAVPFPFGGRQWELRAAGNARDFMTLTDRALPWTLLIAGLVMSALLAGLIGSLASSRERANRLADAITDDLRRSEARLAESQRLTQSVIEALPNPVFFKDTNGRYRGVNQAWERFFGVPRDSFVGKTVHELYPDDKPVADRMHALDQALWDKPGSQSYEAIIPAADGGRHDVMYYKATYARSDGSLAGLVGTIVDISERKQVERRLTMEHAITRVLAESDSTAAAIPQIIRTICETMGWLYGDRYEYDAEADLLRRREFWAVDEPQIQEFANSGTSRTAKPDASGKGLIRRAFGSARPVWIADISKHGSMQRKELVEKAGLHGAFAFPLIAGGQILGVMEFFHRDVRPPDAMLIQIAESIGSQIGQFLTRVQAEEAVKFVAMHDALTQLPNRLMFNQRLEQAIAQAKRHDKRLAVMFIDLDRFKIINDTLGHEAGDHLLREVAQRITEHLRTGDIVARLGGDEFVVLLEDLDDPALMGIVAEKLIASLTENFVIAGREVHVSASIGVSTYPTDAQDMRSLMKFADIAMYRAKEQGRNTFQFYSDQINVHSVERLTLESQLRGALERNELLLNYQPVINVRTGAITALEALVRWQHPEAGLLPPGRFIGIAEETGLIVPIGAWVLEVACAQQRKWMDMGFPRLRIAVNLSPRQFLHRHLVQDVVQALSGSGCDAGCLELEITESTVMHNAPRAVALLTELKAMGIRIAIDDFGTGYSSLAYLKRFPIDSLKIDRSFVSDIPQDPGDTAITQAIIAMSHSLGLKVIAEGVETAEQLDFLREHSCDEVQGYYFSTPVDEAAATAMLRKSFAPQPANVTPLRR